MSAGLFSPITIGPQTLVNRIAVAPMCQYSAVNGSATDWHHVHLGSLALSGAGLVVVEATGVEAAGRITPGCLGLYSDENEARLAEALRCARAVGPAKFGIQLAHAGRKASCNVTWVGGAPLTRDAGAWTTYGPSALAFNDGWHTPVAMTAADMDRVVEAFAQATRRSARLGFEVIELHAAHGYLLHQFLSPLSNQRTDEFGGSFANRMKFPLRVFEAIKANSPAEMAVGARISGSDWVEGGMTIADTIAFAQELERRDCAYLDITSGALDPRAKIPAAPHYQVPFAEAVHKAVKTPVRAVGLITDPHQADAIIKNGQADMVALARAFLSDPRWPWRAAHVLGHALELPAPYRRATPVFWEPAPKI